MIKIRSGTRTVPAFTSEGIPQLNSGTTVAPDQDAESGLAVDRRHALDRDDAFSVRRTSGGYHVRVHVCDLSEVVPIGSALDRQARQLGFTHYRGGWAVTPMLGNELIGTSALAHGVPRPTITIAADLDQGGEVIAATVRRTATACSVLPYEDTDDVLRDRGHQHHEQLSIAYELARILLGRRRARGALVIYDLLGGLASSEEGQVGELAVFERHAGHLIVQELMILANAQLPLWCIEREIPFLSRNHRPSAAAPDRDVLLAELDALASGRITLDYVERRASMLIAAATYDPRSEGHFGLNLPFYAHGTSPLRRYADLATLRNVAAFLRRYPSGEYRPGEGTAIEWPHPLHELETLGHELTELTQAARRARSDELRQRARGRTRALERRTPDLASLPAEEFHRVLRLAVREQRIGDEFAAQVCARFAAGVFTAVDAQVALLGVDGSPPAVASVRQAALLAVVQNPPLAVTVLSAHAVVVGLQPVDYEDEATGQAHARTFRSRASFAGKSGAWRAAMSKKLAQQLATVSLLAALADQPDPSTDAVGAPALAGGTRAVPVPQATGASAISALNEYAQHMGATVTYDYNQTGPRNQPTFHAKATITWQHSDDAESAPGRGPKKPIAKANAAAALLVKLRDRSS
jgi:ribonuclease R